MFDHIKFPPMPSFVARWRAVYLEPVVGSGERLTVLIVINYDQNKVECFDALHPTVIDNLYGAHAQQLKNLIVLLKKSFIKNAGEDASVFDGVYTSKWNNAASQDLYGIVKQALFRSASLGSLALNSLYGDEPETDNHESIDKRWTEEIKEVVLASDPKLSSAFDHTVKIGNLVSVKCGFHLKSYTAKFNVCTSRTVVRMRSSVVELELIKDNNKSEKSDLLILMPNEKDITITKKSLDKMHENVELLKNIVRNHDGINIVPIHTREEGAARILEMARAS